MPYILLIEPDREFASIVRRYFEKKGKKVSVCASAQEAIIHADKKRPQAVVMELGLREHNGVAFLHEFRSYTDWTDVPVIIYSQIPLESSGLSKAAWNKQGVIEYLYKPTIRLEALTQAVNEAI